MADVQRSLGVFLFPVPIRHARRRAKLLRQRVVEAGIKHAPDIAPVHPSQDRADILHRRLAETLRRERPADQRQMPLRKVNDEIVAQGKAPRQPPRRTVRRDGRIEHTCAHRDLSVRQQPQRDRAAHGHTVQPPERTDAPLRQPAAQLGRDGLLTRVGRLFVRVMRQLRQALCSSRTVFSCSVPNSCMRMDEPPACRFCIMIGRYTPRCQARAAKNRPHGGESGGRFFVGDSGHAQAKCVVSHRCREWGKRREVR